MKGSTKPKNSVRIEWWRRVLLSMFYIVYELKNRQISKAKGA